MPERRVALPVKRIGDEAAQFVLHAVQVLVNERELGIHRGSGLVEVAAPGALDAQRYAAGGDDVQDLLHQVVRFEKSGDGSLHLLVVDIAQDGFLGRRIEGAQISRRHAAFAQIILANFLRSRRLFIDDDEYLIGRLGECRAGRQQEKQQNRKYPRRDHVTASLSYKYGRGKANLTVFAKLVETKSDCRNGF